MKLKRKVARFLFDLAWWIDIDEVRECIEECEYVHCDEAFDFICSQF